MRTDRWFTYLFDDSLRRTCGYSGPTPYWDWSRDHADLLGSPIFEESPEYGLGGTGDCDSSPEADCIVTTGAFASSSPSSSSSTGGFQLAWPIPHGLRRNLTLLTGWFAHELPQNRTIGPEFVRNATEHTTGDFFQFQYAMTLMHNHVHNFVGGDLAGDCPKALSEEDCQGMAVSFTPNDPLFWLHHAQLDRLWSVVSEGFCSRSLAIHQSLVSFFFLPSSSSPSLVVLPLTYVAYCSGNTATLPISQPSPACPRARTT